MPCPSAFFDKRLLFVMPRVSGSGALDPEPIFREARSGLSIGALSHLLSAYDPIRFEIQTLASDSQPRTSRLTLTYILH